MPSHSKMTSLALAGAAAYGASQAFSCAPSLARGSQSHSLAATSAGTAGARASNGGTTIVATGALLACAAQAGLRGHKRQPKVPMKAAQDDEPAFSPGQRVVVLAPPAMAGKPGTVQGPATGDSFAVRFDSGSVFNIAEANLQDAASGPVSAPVASAPSVVTSAPAPVAAPPRAGDDEELEFAPGQRVTVLGPPAMAGKQGTVQGPAIGDSFSVRFDSGSVFNIATANLQDASAPAPAPSAPVSVAASPVVLNTSADEDELEFSPGQRVLVLGPPAMAGKQGNVVGPAPHESFAVRFDSGSVFNIATANLQDAATPAAARTASVSSAPQVAVPLASSADEDELAFSPGQRVLVLGPPAMAGRQGTVQGPAMGDSFAVRFDSGSIFNIAEANLQEAGAPMPAATAAPAMAAPAAQPARTAVNAADEELEFAPGQRVRVLGPPAMAGRQGTVQGPAVGDSFAVRFDSGSVFNIATENLQAEALVMG